MDMLAANQALRSLSMANWPSPNWKPANSQAPERWWGWYSKPAEEGRGRGSGSKPAEGRRRKNGSPA
ncbi:hypothetical protein SKAU_G00309200 [Synaphobranchus kaupii]|uniref:Uncharacterized protein n=1 Tax=Synaphobranchus kaupii TaxID=118154 RepID=A0A9Q1ER88_SYNKA|nr:hypothetical protein SKAU_G00309200 [Synaphobranchus kaupii]